MTDHSPTPWCVLDEHLPGIESADDRSIVVYGADEPGDEAGVHGETPDQARANAAFIVKAVNSHEALVKVLERSREMHHADGMWETHPLLMEIDRVLADVSSPPGGDK